MTQVEDLIAADAAVDVEPAPGRRRGGLARAGFAGALVVAAGAGVWLWVADTSDTSPSPTTSPDATATVERGTIAATESWDGSLERGTPFTVKASAGGTITRLTNQGATVGQGNELFRVDEQPVTLLSGVVPMYRDLAPGASGADVAQLETNLAELGHTGFTVDDNYTASTADAVRSWQESIGASATGIVRRGEVLFAPAGGRIDTLRSTVGDVIAPGTPVLDITGADQVVNLQVDVDDLDRFAITTKVTVVLPGGDETAGTVTATAVVDVAADPMAEEGAATESVVQVEITLGENAPEALVGASAEVVVAVDQRTDVLLVPVNALLARTEGGYGLETVADDGTTALVPVETGLFAEGKVEVSGPGIAEGTVVGVAGR